MTIRREKERRETYRTSGELIIRSRRGINLFFAYTHNGKGISFSVLHCEYFHHFFGCVRHFIFDITHDNEKKEGRKGTKKKREKLGERDCFGGGRRKHRKTKGNTKNHTVVGKKSGDEKKGGLIGNQRSDSHFLLFSFLSFSQMGSTFIPHLCMTLS